MITNEKAKIKIQSSDFQEAKEFGWVEFLKFSFLF